MKSEDYGMMGGRYPAVIKSYDDEKRECRVSIEGITDGADVFPLAEIEYPIGDKSRDRYPTEIEIFEGDLVWVSFIRGDPRYPIITGWRNPSVDNSVGTRRWHHENVEVLAETKILLKVGNSQIIMTRNNIKIISDRIDLN